MINSGLKIAVMFFSATGNCKRIAKSIAAHFEKFILIDFTRKLNQKIDMPSCDILFVITPVYSQMCPGPIKSFLNDLKYMGAVVPCVSYGSVSAGKALKQICGIFQKKGSTVLAAGEFASFHSYDPSSDLNAIIDKEISGINELCSKAISRFTENKILKKIPIGHFNIFSLFMPRLRAQIGVKLQLLDKRKCIECQSCKGNCPFSAITQNLKIDCKCFRCGACVKSCKSNNKQLIIRPIMRKYLKKHIDYSRINEIY